MAKTPHRQTYTTSYARALLELAADRQQAEPIGQELRMLRQLVEQEPALALFLSDPKISRADRAGLLDRLLAGKVSDLLMNFLRVLNDKNRPGALVQISQEYDALLDEMLGKIDVDLTVAQKLMPDQLDEVRQKVGSALKKNAIINQQVDESIIGGLTLRVEDKLIDACVKTQLAMMRQQLLSASPK